MLAGAASVDPRAPVARAHVKWKPWAIGAALVLAIAMIAEVRGGGPPEPKHDDTGDVDQDAARDWQHVQDEVDRGHYDQARHHLDDWERRYGATAESRELREHLDDEGPEHGPPGHRGKHGKHD